MTNKDVVSVAGSYPAGDARFTITFGLHIFCERLLPSSCMPSNRFGTKPSTSSLCRF
jgi:hypothetical protein